MKNIINNIIKTCFKKKEKYKFTFFTLLKIIGYIGVLYTPIIVGKIIDLFTINKEINNQLLYLFGELSIISVIVIITWQLSQLYFYKLKDTIKIESQFGLLKKYIGRNFVDLEKRNNSIDFEKINKASNGLSNFISLYSLYLLDIAVSIPFIFISLFLQNYILGIVLSFLFLLLILSQFILNKKIKNHYSDFLNNDNKKFSELLDSINNINTIKYLNLEKNIFNKLENIKEVTILKIKRYVFLIRLKWIIFHVLGYIFLLVGLGLSIYLSYIGELSVGFIAVVYFFIDRIDKLSTIISSINNQIIEIIENIKGIKELNLFNNEKDNKNNNIKIENIKISNLSFSYGGKLDNNIIDGFNLDINKKDKILVYGKSGSGKSTFANILSGFYKNYKGNIIINDKEEIKKLDNISVKYISQNSDFFNMSIRDNFNLVKNISDKELEEILLKNNCNFVFDLKDGLNTIINEKSKNLSGGEKQRLAFVRSLLLEGDVFIYDEITANLDKDNRKKMINNILKYHEDKIVLFISHFDDGIDLFTKTVKLK